MQKYAVTSVRSKSTYLPITESIYINHRSLMRSDDRGPFHSRCNCFGQTTLKVEKTYRTYSKRSLYFVSLRIVSAKKNITYKNKIFKIKIIKMFSSNLSCCPHITPYSFRLISIVLNSFTKFLTKIFYKNFFIYWI